MSNRCKTPGCGSYAINDHLHGRAKGADLDLCDVCYWRVRAEALHLLSNEKTSMLLDAVVLIKKRLRSDTEKVRNEQRDFLKKVEG